MLSIPIYKTLYVIQRQNLLLQRRWGLFRISTLVHDISGRFEGSSFN